MLKKDEDKDFQSYSSYINVVSLHSQRARLCTEEDLEGRLCFQEGC